MNIAMVSGESLPFSKTGGLGDVCYSLSKEFVKKGHNVAIFTPLYKNFDFLKNKNVEFLFPIDVRMSWRNDQAKVLHIKYKKIDYYFIQNQRYFERDNMYGYDDDGERFAFFQLAVLETIKHLPMKFDVIHTHDWQAAMIPCLLKVRFKDDYILGGTKTVLTIHNPLFKGYLKDDALYDLYELPHYLYENGSTRLKDMVSTLKAGIFYADKITTVSPTHAEELKTYEGSKGLDYDLILREQDFVGIINGMDYDEFNTRTDKLIPYNYKITEADEGKLKNKEAFCKEHGLDPKMPMFSVVSRLTSQKGLDLINCMADYIVRENGIFCVLGSGEYYAEEHFNDLYRRYPNNSFVYIGYNNDVAHQLYAASDFFIMPSAFEPCGLGQMIAHRYGTLPIVRRTGGLKDSVIPYYEYENNVDVADGFGFDDYNAMDALNTCKTALHVYYDEPETFKKLRHNAIRVNHKWATSADQYIELYNSIHR